MAEHVDLPALVFVEERSLFDRPQQQAFLDLLVADGLLILPNVAAEEGAPRVEGEEMVILTPEQLAGLPDRLAGYKTFPRAIVVLFTGMRRGEVLAMRWRNVDLDSKVIRIREALEETKEHGIRFQGAKTKTGRRDISLPDIVV